MYVQPRNYIRGRAVFKFCDSMMKQKRNFAINHDLLPSENSNHGSTTIIHEFNGEYPKDE
jgi:hypothetical protein